ncbi:MAG: bifunctional folylpolyglutamate synthase/dihydrofolate synthase [Thermoplasmatota archaeon]
MDPFEYLESRGYFNINPGLGRIDRVLRHFGSPHLSIPAVHIGGTNGKGSTAAIVESVLGEFPLRTGLYTSPHLLRITERLRINGSEIEKDELGEAMSQVMEVEMDEEPTYFELVTAASMLLMERKRVDVNISEVGMGGRWDATNVLEPQAIAITSISMDHMEHLGDDPVSITIEKCGIIKPSTPVVVGEVCSLLEERERCLRTILDQCTHNGCPVVLVSTREGVARKMELLSSYNIPDWRIISVSGDTGNMGTMARFEIVGPRDRGQVEPKFRLLDEIVSGEFDVPLMGPHQAINAAIAVSLSLLVLPFGLSHSRLKEGDTSALTSLISGETDGIHQEYRTDHLKELIRKGLAKVRLIGRMERFTDGKKELYVDGGHNIEAARSIANSLRSIHPDGKVVLLLAMMKDKEVADFLRNLDLDIGSMVLTSLPYERSMIPKKLLEGIVMAGTRVDSIHIRPDINDGIGLWRKSIGEGEIGLATGSFYLYRFVVEALKDQKV